MIEIRRSQNDSGTTEGKKEIPPVIVGWNTPFKLNPDTTLLRDMRYGKRSGFGGYYDLYVPIEFADGSAEGDVRFVRKDSSWRDSGVLINGERVFDRPKGLRFVSTQVLLYLKEPIGLQDVHLNVQTPDGVDRFMMQRTSACGAVPKAKSDNTFMYFSTGKLGKGATANPVVNLGLEVLYIPLSYDNSRLDQVLLFSFDRFPVDGSYYRKFPVMRDVLRGKRDPK